MYEKCCETGGLQKIFGGPRRQFKPEHNNSSLILRASLRLDISTVKEVIICLGLSLHL